MNQRTLLILVGLAVVALGGGWYFGTRMAPTQQKSIDAGRLMFPDLAPKLQNAAKIEIVFQAKSMTIVLKDGRWVMTDRGDYPVQETQLRAMLTALTELRLIEPRTADPAAFARLGVEDAASADANSNLLRVLDRDGKPIVEIITGHRKTRTQGNLTEQVYVRRPGDNQSWLAEGALAVVHDPGQWLDRDLMDIAHDRIVSVTVDRGGAKLVFARENDKLVLSDPAEHPKLEDFKVDDIARVFESLTFQEVRTAAETIGEKLGSAVFTTADGLTIVPTVFKADKAIWVAFEVSGTDKAKAEADALSRKLSGWVYEVGAWKETALVPRIEDLKAAEKPADATAPAAAPAESPKP